MHKSFSSWNNSFLYCDLSEFVNGEGWWCRLGWLIRFISHSIISGFTTGSAIIIGLSQAKNFLGYDVTGSSKFIPLMESIISGLPQVVTVVFLCILRYVIRLHVMKELTKDPCKLMPSPLHDLWYFHLIATEY